MTRLVVAGVSPQTRYFLRYGLSQQHLEFAGILAQDDLDGLVYGFLHDSGVSPFKGEASVRDAGLILAGRYGRGGLRHDTIPLLSADALADLEVDALVVAETWPLDRPIPAVRDGVRVIDIRGADAGPDGSVVGLCPAHRDAASRICSALSTLAAIRSGFAAASGLSVAGAQPHEALARLQPGGAAQFTRASVWDLVGSASPLLAAETLSSRPPEVVQVSLGLTLVSEVEQERVVKRLTSSCRNEIGDAVGIQAGPLASEEARGSGRALVDAASVRVHGDQVTLTYLVHERVYQARALTSLLQ